MKVSKLFLLGVLPFILALSSCGQTGSPKVNKLHDAYEFSRIETSNGEGTDVVLNQYSNSYMEFDQGTLDEHGDEYYRFTYTVSMEYGGMSIVQVYEEFGNFDGPGYSDGSFYFNVFKKFTLVNGVRTSAESTNKLSYELDGDSLRVKVTNGNFVVGTFLMDSVTKKVPTYASDFNFFARINLDSTYYSNDYFDKYVASKAYFNETDFYFTYRQGGYICKEVGIITDNVLNPDRGSAELPIYEIQIVKLIKYQNDVQVSEESVLLSRGYEEWTNSLGRKIVTVFVNYGGENPENIGYSENKTFEPSVKPELL